MSDTPRTDKRIVIKRNPETGDRTPWVRPRFARILERELTAANSRIVELEKETDSKDRVINSLQSDYSNLLKEDAKSHQEVKSLTRQLSETQDKFAHAMDSWAEQNIIWEAKLNAEKQILSETQAQLAYAREDVVRLDWLEDRAVHIELYGGEFREGKIIPVMRSAIDAARGHVTGTTETPATAAVEPASAWLPIETAPKDGSEFLMCYPLQGNLRIVGWFSPIRGCFITTGGQSATIGWLWQPLPPPPTTKGKEQGQ